MNSFIVPAHNEQGGIGRMLQAIHDAMRVVGEPYEVIVVDDASTDSTAEIARQHNATVLPVNHRQIAATRNSGARAARGERLFFVDADTIINPRVVSAALRALNKGAAGGGAPVRLAGPVPHYARLLLVVLSGFMWIAGLTGGAFMFCTREAFAAVGGFDERLFGAEDAAMSSALKREGRFVVLWARVLTSGRRARSTSGLKMLTFIVSTAVFPSRLMKRRSSVEKMWYESNRENDEQNFTTLSGRVSNAAALLIMVVLITGPVWMLPWPEALFAGPLGTVRFAIQVFHCHVGLLLWPCAYFLFRSLLRQTRRIEQIKLVALITLCVCFAWSTTREVIWLWEGLFQWLAGCYAR